MKVTQIFTENLRFWMGLCGENADAVNRLDLQCVSIAVPALPVSRTDISISHLV